MTQNNDSAQSFDIPEFLEKLCFIELWQYTQNDRDIEDIGLCLGQSCNYCGRWNKA